MVNFNDSSLNTDDSLPPELRVKIEAALETAGRDMNMLQFLLDQAKDDYNSSHRLEIGGFSPDMLSALQRYEWTDPEYPLKLSDLSNDLVAHAPFFQQTRTFLIAVRDSGGIKMTAKGNLPRSFVNTMVDVFLNEEKKPKRSACAKS